MMDPTQATALHSLDFGSIYTPDGREHPVTALSLPFLANLTNPSMSQPSSSNPTDAPSTYPPTGANVGSVTQQAGFAWPDFLTPKAPQHLGARFVVGLVALIILTIVIARLLK